MSATAGHAAETATAAALVGARGLWPMLGGLVRRAIAILLALHPLGALLVLGWLMRLMRDEAALNRRMQAADLGPRRAPLPSLVMADPAPGRGWLMRQIGGLWLNLRDGVAALVTTTLGTLPFTALWLMSWWGGWENSFNKGYEQSWIGPSLGLLGTALALPLLTRLPMALAHQAAEGRMSAFFARHPVARLIRAAGWRYAVLAVLSALAALPLFALQGMPVFVEDWSPGFVDRDPEDVQTFIAGYRLVATAYLVLVLIALRRMAARLHARASLIVEAGGPARGTARRLGAWACVAVCWAAWFAVVAQVFVAQFLNHQWVVWFIPPLSGLPFFAPLTPLP